MNCTSEIWKPVVGYEGKYEVSNLGRVRSIDRINVFEARGKKNHRFLTGKILTPQFDGRGHYLHVQLSNGEKSRIELVHRLVAKAFIENPYNFPEVNHKDENKTNNMANNLEWCDHKYNNNYGSKVYASRGENNGAAKLNAEIIRAIRNEFIPHDKEHGITGLAKKYGISVAHAHQIVFKKRWGWMD